MLAILFYLFLAYLLYRLVFGFILPLYRTTRQVKKTFREMNDRMQAAQGGSAEERPTTPNKKSNTDGVGEYIDFEEVP